MSLISYGTGAEPEASEVIQNNGFWPDIAPDQFRSINRIDDSITSERVVHALVTAITDVNRQLASWQTEQTDLGATDIDDVAPPSWAREEHFTDLYLRAVYASAKAELLEGYRDYSATTSADVKGVAKDEAAEDYRRNARWAVAEVMGQGHTTVELI